MTALAGGWVSAIASDPALLAVVLLALGLLLTTTLMLLGTLLLSRHHERRARRAARVRQQWMPRLLGMLTGADDDPETTLPRLARRDMPALVSLCNALQDTVRGVSRESLQLLAQRLGLIPELRSWLRRGDAGRQLDALTCLGQLRIDAAWPDIQSLMDQDNTVLSLTAARALVNIDAPRGVPEILQRLQRADWSESRVTALLKEVPANTLIRMLQQNLLTSEARAMSAPALRKLIRITNSLQPHQVEPLLQLARERFPDDAELRSTICACADGPQWLAYLRTATTDEYWPVRVQAVRRLGRIGEPADRIVLAARLEDPVWWVRYRAAQALLGLPDAQRQALQIMARVHDSQRVREILAHALAEVR
ncbi:HEAT repeat domain-containing protein [Alcanivorax sp. JB21]|uniref:HEAT repeat domain-containing protein n=1 Tax=Alcanivorax limicola TaxID=2874102 RepID=UPI001CBF6A77|nr:HEAT repeat domain-containing protein [Alcanivorax limicola]MBZ2189364.1 HEAT repeat domain-containing protein [Alcanivorax limicola]